MKFEKKNIKKPKTTQKAKKKLHGLTITKPKHVRKKNPGQNKKIQKIKKK
jgi:hypothetical protein